MGVNGKGDGIDVLFQKRHGVVPAVETFAQLQGPQILRSVIKDRLPQGVCQGRFHGKTDDLLVVDQLFAIVVYLKAVALVSERKSRRENTFPKGI